MSKRTLTYEEINNILEGIQLPYNILSSTKKSVLDRHKKIISDQLKKIHIYPQMIPNLKKEILTQFDRTLVQAGESVGIIAAQSIGERQTQMTLDTFHSAGLSVETVVTGIPKFSELMNATKDPKSVLRTLYLKNKMETIAEIRDIVRNSIVYLEIESILDNYEICKNKDEEEWYKTFELIYGDEFKKYKNCIRIVLNIEKIFEYKLCLKKISSIIEEISEDLVCVFSPSWNHTIDIFMSDKIFANIDSFLPSLKKVKITGIDNITSLTYKRENNEWCIVTHGNGDFVKLLSLDFVDKNKILSNNLWDIYKIFGIEATRQFLIDEFIKVISSDGTYINQRHVMIIVDIMTYKGSIVSVSRYGIERKESGVFSKASFEESLDNFLKASLFTDKESTEAVSGAIMCGKVPKIGSGICSLMLDLDSLEENKKFY